MQGGHTHPLFDIVRRNLNRLSVRPENTILAGVSGGVDSMSMLYLLHTLGYKVTCAHVNFNLRGAESINDALFVRQWCHDQQIPFLELSTNTKVYAAEEHLNTQSAARQIRYAWWEITAHEQSFDYIATAHHLDDSIETLFLNLLRGTGLKGMLGIPSRRDKYIRPLLDCTRDAIESFSTSSSIPFRTDQSNLEDVYQRNKLRHQLIPKLKDFNTDFYAVMEHNLHRARVEWDAWEHAYLSWQEQYIQAQEDGWHIRDNLQLGFVLRWREERGFPWQLSYDFLTTVSRDANNVLRYNKWILSRTHNGYFLEEPQPSTDLIINHPGEYDLGHFSFSILPAEPTDFTTSKDRSVEYINSRVVQWPLHLRSVKPGDQFQPLGMNGKSKKLQDLMVDLKMDLFSKERVLLLCNADHILWVSGIRLDERAKVLPEDDVIYRVDLRVKTKD